MDDQNKNLILAMVLSTLVLVVWMVLFAPPPDAETGPQAVTETGDVATLPSAATPEAVRVPIETPNLRGSISLAGSSDTS